MVQKHVPFAPGNKWGQAPFLQGRGYSRPVDRTPENGARPHFFASMSERSELPSCREERWENGVKHLKGSESIPEYYLFHFTFYASRFIIYKSCWKTRSLPSPLLWATVVWASSVSAGKNPCRLPKNYSNRRKTRPKSLILYFKG